MMARVTIRNESPAGDDLGPSPITTAIDGAGLRRDWLCRELDIPRKTLWRWEVGKALPHLSRLIRLSRILGLGGFHDEFGSQGESWALKAQDWIRRARPRWSERA